MRKSILFVALASVAAIGLTGCQKAHSAVSVAARASVASPARASVSAPRVSTPAPVRASAPVRPRPAAKPIVTPPPAPSYSAKKKKKRDDDVECSTLRYSSHPADRQVFNRYC